MRTILPYFDAYSLSSAIVGSDDRVKERNFSPHVYREADTDTAGFSTVLTIQCCVSAPGGYLLSDMKNVAGCATVPTTGEVWCVRHRLHLWDQLSLRG